MRAKLYKVKHYLAHSPTYTRPSANVSHFLECILISKYLSKLAMIKYNTKGLVSDGNCQGLCF